MANFNLSLVDILKQHRPCLVFETLSKPHDPDVRMSCVVDSTSFQAVGGSFEMAKQQVAIKVLNHLIVHDGRVRADHRFAQFLKSANEESPPKPTPCVTVPEAANGMSPLMLFNQISQADAPEWNLQHVSFRPSNYKATLTVRSRMFEGEDNTKKLAKQKAALLALQDVYGVSTDSLRMPSLPKRRRPAEEESEGATGVPGGDGGGPPAAKRKRRSGPFHKNSDHLHKNRNGGGGNFGSSAPNSRPPPTFSKLRNPLQMLNEFRRGISFTVTAMVGPSHQPTITMEATIDGQTFTGQGNSKQRAKLALGVRLIDYFEETGQLRLIDPEAGALVTSDSYYALADSWSCDSETPMRAGNGAGGGGGGAGGSAGVKTPLMRLYELSSTRPELDTWEEKDEKMFVASFMVNGRAFQGRGVTKQKAKHAAAEEVLREVYNVRLNANANATNFPQGNCAAAGPLVT